LTSLRQRTSIPSMGRSAIPWGRGSKILLPQSRRTPE
jgi:hypothetical protein